VALPSIGFETKSPFRITDHTFLLEHAETGKPLYLHVHAEHLEDVRSRKLSIFSEFLLVDRTTLGLHFKELKVKGNMRKDPSLPARAPGQISVTLFSFPKRGLHGRSLCVQGEGTNWSLPFVIDATATKGQLDLTGPSNGDMYQLGVYIKLGSGVFRFSKVVQVSPRFNLINDTTCEVRARQTTRQSHLPPDLPQIIMPTLSFFLSLFLIPVGHGLIEDPFGITLKPTERGPFFFKKCDITRAAVEFSFTKGKSWTPPVRVSDIGFFDLKIEDDVPHVSFPPWLPFCF